MNRGGGRVSGMNQGREGRVGELVRDDMGWASWMTQERKGSILGVNRDGNKRDSGFNISVDGRVGRLNWITYGSI